MAKLAECWSKSSCCNLLSFSWQWHVSQKKNWRTSTASFKYCVAWLHEYFYLRGHGSLENDRYFGLPDQMFLDILCDVTRTASVTCPICVWVSTHWAHDAIVTLDQRHWRWFNIATTSCSQWAIIRRFNVAATTSIIMLARSWHYLWCSTVNSMHQSMISQSCPGKRF